MANGQLGGVLRYIRQLVGTGAAGPAGDRTDGQLLDAFAQNHDPNALDALVRRYASLVWGVCRRVLRDEHEAEDAFQGTFLVLVRRAAALDRRGSLANWLYTVAYHLALRARLQTARRRVQEKEAADMATPEADTFHRELSDLLDEELHLLPDKYRQPLVLCYLQGKTNEEAAQELGYPAGSMSRHLTRGRDLLRERLSSRGIALSTAVLTAGLAETANASAPPATVNATIQAALVYAAGQAAGTVSPSVVALAEGLLQATAVSKIKLIAAFVLALSLLGTGSVLAYRHLEASREPRAVPERPGHAEQRRPAAGPLTLAEVDGGLSVAVDRTVDAWQPTRAERRIDDIGWAKDLRDARRLAKEHNRPILLLVHGGDLATGRCCAGGAHSRASALSNDRVIGLLNHEFIPVAISNRDYYGKDGRTNAEEKTEFQRIRNAAQKKGLLGGSSWVYVLDSEGEPLDSLHGCTAAVAQNLLDLLEWYARDLGTREGEPVSAPVPLSRAPQAEPDDLVLHLTSRYLKRQDDSLVPLQAKLGTDKVSSWHGYPAENWIVLGRDEWSRLLPAEAPELGSKWTLDASVTERLLLNFYPQTEDNDLARNRIDQGSIRGTVVAVSGDRVRARLEGKLRMKHAFVWTIPDERFVDATILGYIDFDRSRQHISALRLYTPQATYGAESFGVAVRSVR
jgi:RNA polymerase sigma factor (sigma-70 family)